MKWKLAPTSATPSGCYTFPSWSKERDLFRREIYAAPVVSDKHRHCCYRVHVAKQNIASFKSAEHCEVHRAMSSVLSPSHFFFRLGPLPIHVNFILFSSAGSRRPQTNNDPLSQGSTCTVSFWTRSYEKTYEFSVIFGGYYCFSSLTFSHDKFRCPLIFYTTWFFHRAWV